MIYLFIFCIYKQKLQKIITNTYFDCVSVTEGMAGIQSDWIPSQQQDLLLFVCGKATESPFETNPMVIVLWLLAYII